MITSQSRVQIVNAPVAAPGVCILCGSASDENRKFIDFGKQLDWYGAVYLCTLCMLDVAEAIGYISKLHFDSLNLAHKKLQAEYAQLEAKYKTVKDALGALLDNPSDPIGSIAGPVVSDVDEPESPTPAIDSTAATTTAANESSDIEGIDDFFDDTDAD